MQRLFGVLAVTTLCVARPEADPALLLTHPADAHPLPLLAHPAPLLAHPTPLLAHPTPLLTHPTPLLAHPAPVLAHSVEPVFHSAPVLAHPAPILAHSVEPIIPAPLILPTAHAVPHHPVVKSVVELPAEVSHEVVAHPFVHHAPLFHHAAPLVHHTAPLVHHTAPLAHHAAPLVHHAAPLAHHVDPVALSTGALHQVEGGRFVDFGRKKREADADALAEALADPYFYASVSTPYASYGSFVPDAHVHHPVVAHVDARVHHGNYGHGYYGHPYGYYAGHHGFNYYG